MQSRPSRRRVLGRRDSARLLAAVCAAAAVAVTAGAPAPVAAAPLVEVVVTGPDVAAAADAVTAAGGHVTHELPLVDGVSARLSANAQLGEEFRVTADHPLSFASTTPDPQPVSTVRATLGLPPAGHEGAGLTVALVDTGVADVADLRGRVEHVDVTGTGGGDGYGHGTFLAGLLAGDGTSSGGAYAGVAPAARILDVKVARADGSTDLSSVLLGLQVVADRGPRQVQVLNLALSSGSPVPYQVDPLNQALRTLWRRGITVVVASGNDGPEAGSVSTPGNDPLLLTVGALDERGTPARGDDVLAAFSGRGPTSQGVHKPEVLAPGVSMIGLRSVGSVADTSYPQARIGDSYFRGSGTSMSAAVTSGAVAAVLAENRRLGPDDVKALLTRTAYGAAELGGIDAAGSGGIDAAAALAEAPSVPTRAVAVVRPAPGDPAEWQALAAAFEAGDRDAAAEAWRELSPQARSWAGRSWSSLDPVARSWAGRSWSARSWAGKDGTAEEWTARSWAARSWAGDDWAARSWAGDDWAARSWAGDDWAARSWATATWSARSWAADWR